MAKKPTYEELEKKVAGLERKLSERVKREAVLNTELQQLSAISDNINEIFYVVDPKTHEILYTSNHFQKVFGSNPVGRICYQTLHSADKPCPFCAGENILKKRKRPYKREYYEPRSDRHFMVSECMIGWPDGRNVRLELVIDIEDRVRIEKKLRESEEQFRQLADAAWEAIAIHDQGILLHANKQYFNMFGYEPHELIGKQALQMTAAPQSVEFMRKKIRSRNLGPYEVTGLRKDGTEFPMEIRVKMMNYNGSMVRVAAIRDITERKQIEAELRRHREKLESLVAERTLELEKVNKELQHEIMERRQGEDELLRIRKAIECTSDAISIHDKEGRLFYHNKALSELYGFATEEFEADGGVTKVFADQRIVQNINETINKAGAWSGESEMVKKSGQKFQARIRIDAVKEDSGNVIGYIGVTSDISEQKKAEEALRRIKERFTNVHRAVNEGIWEYDMGEDKLKYFSDRFMEIMGFKLGELITSETWAERIHPDHKNKVQTRLREIAPGETAFELEYKYNNNKNGYIWIQNTGLLLNKDEKGNQLVVGSVRDITERKQAEKEKRELQVQLQQAQKMEALGTLAGGIAHDFNNLLQSIIVNTELGIHELGEKGLETKRLKQILKASKRAKELVRQIVTFSRQREKKQSLLKLAPLVKESLKLLRSTLPATIEVRQNIRARNDTILADPTQMNQIIMNLCTNAAHAMQQKGGVLEVALLDIELNYDCVDLDAELTPGNYITLSVSDTGHGMEKTVMERIFDPFFTTKKPGEGTGMGLSVVHGIVKACKGKIIVDSEPGKGTMFQIFFPRVEKDVVTVNENPAPLLKGGERILLVDDEKMIIDALRPALENLGYTVVSKKDGDEALNTFRTDPEQFDLIITDQTMPNITGAELAKRLMSIRSDIPIILCTGFSDLITPKEAYALGVRELLVKPINTNEISTAIRRVLDIET